MELHTSGGRQGEESLVDAGKKNLPQNDQEEKEGVSVQKPT